MLVQVYIDEAGEKKPSIEIHPVEADTTFQALFLALVIDSEQLVRGIHLRPRGYGHYRTCPDINFS